jgi:hypothetical protein
MIMKVYYNLELYAINLLLDGKISQIDKLRVIHLFKADYNAILKIMWARKAVWKMNYNNLLNMGQASSRPGCRAIEVAIAKEMKYDYSTLTRTIMATIDNNAKNCYNCILCNVSVLISQLYGISNNY